MTFDDDPFGSGVWGEEERSYYQSWPEVAQAQTVLIAFNAACIVGNRIRGRFTTAGADAGGTGVRNADGGCGASRSYGLEFVMPVRVKYPRTPHLPWSPGLSPDDLVATSLDRFLKEPVVVTEKRDGENTTLYADGLHARSTDSRHHPARSWVKKLHASIRHRIPDGWRICGENLYARHSIAYTDLRSFFEVFSVWNDANVCLDWGTTLDFCRRLGLETVPEIHRGAWDERLVRRIPETRDLTRFEGYVVRVAGAFGFADFSECVAKWVRAGHVQTDEDWLRQPVIPNLLQSGSDPLRPQPPHAASA